ncbi:MAG: M56 family metallopeptidase, partial [Planctomycetes bacterium]|nr:M56 family metallopeptidase [Planctomycetota bacterium]
MSENFAFGVHWSWPSDMLVREVSERLGWVLLHSLWLDTIVALLVAVGLLLLRRASATVRYTVLVGALGLATGLPLVIWFSLPENLTSAVPRTETTTPVQVVAESEASLPSGPDAVGAVADVPGAMAGLVSPADMEAATTIESERADVVVPVAPAVASRSWQTAFEMAIRPCLGWIAVCWMVGVLICSFRPLLGWRFVRRLQRIGIAPVAESTRQAFQRVVLQLQISNEVQIWTSALAQAPVVVGYFRPAILLPVSLVTSIPVSQLEAILAHELAHIRRHDYLVHLWQTLVETVYFYHPAIWWLSHRIRVEREHCCDDVVIDSLGNPVEYGRALVAVGELYTQRNLLALGAADGSLLGRVRRIVGLAPDRASVSGSVLAGIATCTLLIVLACYSIWGSVQADATERAVTAVETKADELAAADETEPGGAEPAKTPGSRATLPGGRSVEIVGLVKNTRPASEGWNPDGSPLGDAGHWPSTIVLHGKNTTAAYQEGGPHPDPDDDAVDVLLRFRGLKGQPSLVFDTPTRGVNYHHQPVADPYEIRVSARWWSAEELAQRGGDPGTWIVGLTDRAWGRPVKIDLNGKITDPIADNEPYAEFYRLIDVRGVRPNARVPVTGQSLVIREPDIRSGIRPAMARYALEIRGIDETGAAHSVNYWASSPVLNSDIMESEYGLSQPLPDGRSLSHYEFRLRPYQFLAKFEHVAQQPGQRTKVATKVSILFPEAADVAEKEKLHTELDLPRQEFFLGESIPLNFVMTNVGETDLPYGQGAVYLDLRINDGFRLSGERLDDNGQPVGQPVATWP